MGLVNLVCVHVTATNDLVCVCVCAVELENHAAGNAGDASDHSDSLVILLDSDKHASSDEDFVMQLLEHENMVDTATVE